MSSNLRTNILSTSLAQRMSDVLNSYLMFQPRGPYLRRSCTTAWKKASPTNSFFQYLLSRFALSGSASSPSSVPNSSHSCSPSVVKVPIRLARMPLGGSYVSLMPFCSTATGNAVEGMEDSQSLNESSSTPCVLKVSTIFSSDPIQDVARWQFMSITQSPFFVAAEIIFSATGPCPCPREMVCSLFNTPFSSANLISAPVGSVPVDSTKITGVLEDVSGNTSARTTGGDSVKALPSFSMTYFSVANTSFSWRKILSTHMVAKLFRSVAQGAGRGVSCGASAVAHTFHSFTWPMMWSQMPTHSAERFSCNPPSISHCTCEMKDASGVLPVFRETAPRSRKFHSAKEICFSVRMIEVVMRKEKMSLCRSKSPLHTFLYMKSVMKDMRMDRRFSSSCALAALSIQ
mmetsp:Transcript_60210/g.148097  ORF Transcript_60210/g.148097 Transcript_60210/m.148097 type:complete len:402 (-) Transcript_60210:75-1280(-)